MRGAFENFQMLQRRPTEECHVRKERVLCEKGACVVCECRVRKERVSWSPRSGPPAPPRSAPLVSLGFTSSPRESEVSSGSREGRPSAKPVLEVVAVITRSQSWWSSVGAPGPEHVPVWGRSECHRTLSLRKVACKGQRNSVL